MRQAGDHRQHSLWHIVESHSDYPRRLLPSYSSQSVAESVISPSSGQVHSTGRTTPIYDWRVILTFINRYSWKLLVILSALSLRQMDSHTSNVLRESKCTLCCHQQRTSRNNWQQICKCCWESRILQRVITAQKHFRHKTTESSSTNWQEQNQCWHRLIEVLISIFFSQDSNSSPSWVQMDLNNLKLSYLGQVSWNRLLHHRH